jgi:hypothetical protein
MTTAVFRRRGGALTASVTCRPRRDGRYTLTLWRAGENEIVAPSPWSGNFVNDDDDAYRLPGRAGTHDGRLLECLATVSVPHGVRPARVTLRVEQKGAVLAEEHLDVPPGSPAGQVLLFIALEAK